MNILICGKNTPYVKNIAERLKREKNEIHYISGSKASDKVGNAVFQQFDFEYTNPNIGRIVKSARADVMVLLGSSDKNYSWRNPADDAMTFVSGMSSLLMAAKGSGVKRVIFISSVEVFENNEGDPRCDTLPEASAPMLDAFVQVENLCRNVEEDEMQVDILRLPQVTGYYDSNSLNDFCLMAVQRCFYNDRFSYSPEKLHSVMNYQDAADAIIKLIGREHDKEKKIFQLKGVICSEQEIMDAMSKTGWTGVRSAEKIKERKAKDYPPARLAESDDELLHFSLRFNIEEIIEQLRRAIETHKKEEEKGKEKRLHFLPVIEAVVCAVLVTLITYFLRQTWVGDHFSFFVLYALLFGGVYGTTYGLFSGLLATIGTLVIQWHDAGLINTLENYYFFLYFLQYILVGVIAGYMHDKYVRKTTSLREERNYLAAEVNDLTRINDNSIYVNNVYERRLVGYENSLPRLYEMTSRLDFLESETVIFQAALVTQELLEVEDVAIYMSSQRSKYFRLSAATSERATSCGKSYKYDEEAFLYAPFEQREIYKNKEMNKEYPSFAGSVMDEDRINAIIMVWTRDIHKINQYECDMLAIVCRLIENAMVRANRYLDAIRHENYIENTRIMKEEPFLQHYNNYLEGSREGVFNFSLLYIPPEEGGVEDVQRMTRDTDVIGMVDDAIYILLPFANETDSAHVAKRFMENGMAITPVPKESLAEKKPAGQIAQEQVSAEQTIDGQKAAENKEGEA